MNEELTLSDYIIAAVIVVLLVFSCIYIADYYSGVFEPPPETLPPISTK